MLRLPRVVNANTLKACTRQSSAFRPIAQQSRQFSVVNTQKQFFTPVKRAFDTKNTSFGASKILALATVSSATTPLLFRNPVHCQAAFAQRNETLDAAVKESNRISAQSSNKPIFNKGELTFGTFLGICTGFLVKKVGKIFAAFVGTGFVFLQYLSQQGYVTVHWDRLEGRYISTLDKDGDGKVSKRDLHSKWQTFINLLTNNIQFKSTFLIGFYAGMRYG